jgi:hypothetical protein
VMQHVANDGADWMRIAKAADAADLAGKPVPLDYTASEKVRTIDFRGYAYTRTQSEMSGALMTRYDETKPQVWKVPLRDEIIPGRVVDAPRAGYIVPAAHAAWVGEKLKLHGVQFHPIQAHDKLAVQTFRATSTKFGGNSVEGHQRLTLEGAWKPETRDVGNGALFVPIAQPKARLVMALLEPQAPDALAAWGEFNNAFEQKEYMEAYVAEEVAETMLKDPKVRAQFDAALKDEAFAKDPDARLAFFAKRHASWDERFNLYPVLRVDTAP